MGWETLYAQLLEQDDEAGQSDEETYELLSELAEHPIALNQATREDLERILEAKNRSMAPETAPPQGLFLMKVFYDEAELQSYKLDGLPFGW